MAKTDYRKKDKKVDLALLGEELGGRVPPQAMQKIFMLLLQIS